MPVNTPRPDFKKLCPDYEQIADNKAGQRVVKKKREKYLPIPNASDESEENLARYESYLLRAVFHNVVARTVENMVGQCFTVAPVATVPDEMQPWVEDIDAAGNSAEQQSKLALDHTFSFSRAFLWVDYPKTGGVVSIAQKEEGHIRPRVILCDPRNVINWRVTATGAKSKLSLVVIREEYIKKDDGFEAEYAEQFRVLRLTDGVFYQELYREGSGVWLLTERVMPLRGDTGQPWDEIPGTFIGAKSNDPELEKPLMLDISNLNFAHYRNSADYEEITYMVGQPTPYITGLTEKWVNDVLKGQVFLGSRSCIPLPKDATAGLLQAAPNTLPKEAMDQKEALMQTLGARLVEKKEVKQTATQSGIDESSETSIAASCVHNVTAAYCKAFRWAAIYDNITVGDPEKEILFELNDDFAIARMTPEERNANREDFNAGLLLLEEARDNLLSGGAAYVEDIEEFKDKREEEQAAEMEKAQKELDAQTAAAAELIKAKGAATPPAGKPPVAPPAK